MTPPLDLAALRKMLAKATPGPWREGSVDRDSVFGDIGNPACMAPELGRVVCRTNRYFDTFWADAALIAAAVNALPQLLALVDAQAEEIERLTEKLNRLHEDREHCNATAIGAPTRLARHCGDKGLDCYPGQWCGCICERCERVKEGR